MKKFIYGFMAGLALLTVTAMCVIDEPKTAYVELNMIYNDFQMKKELEAKLTNVQQTRKTILDSLELRLKVLSAQLRGMAQQDKKVMAEQAGRFEALREEYFTKQKMFSEDNDRTTGQYSEQIWKQINQYVKDYGKENGYAYIFGADGSGALMYGTEKENITDKLKAYVNERYQGKTQN